MLERIGNCRIVDEVASGGMAVVYRAVQDPLGRTVAIKALKSSAASEENVAVRFEREAKSLANLQHENIIHVYDFHRERGALFIVMEYVQGTDLYDLLDKCGRLPYDVAAIIAMQVARALDYVHYRGIIHRDIKPANIMIARAGGVKLMDFGIAHDNNFDDLTEAGTGIGTPAYMSPEQVLGDKLDASSDIFSLGVVLYQMITGKKPFVEDEQKSAMHKIRLEKHVSVRRLNPEIPRELERIVDRCLEKQPRDRWRSAQHMVMALERFLAKHVEMNHHARLVLFLRAQNVITELEAEEYLNPAALGAGGSALAQPNMQARHVVRAGVVAHAIMFGVLLLMLGLIHVAPLGATPQTQTVIKELGRGFVRVNAVPWATVSVDGKVVGVTPMAKPIELTEGTHVVRFEHDWYAPVDRTVTVARGGADTAQEMIVDFERVGVAKQGKKKPGGGSGSSNGNGSSSGNGSSGKGSSSGSGSGSSNGSGSGGGVVRLWPIAILLIARSAMAAPDSVAMYRAKAGDTLELIAAEYYGDRNDAVFIMVENHILHPRPLRPGDKLRIPVSREYTTSPGDTFEALAATYLGDARRGPFLAEFNGIGDASLAAGTTLSIPFHVAHTAAASESLANVAAAYFGDAKQADMLQHYNFLDRSTLEKGESIVVPIFHVRVRTSKLPPIDAESKARRDRRQASADRAAAALPAARTAWRAGDFAAVKRELAGLDVDYLDAAVATEIGELLGSAYLAYDDADVALATFKRVIERDPHATLDPYAVSPKILAVWQRAGGHLDGAP